MRFYGEEPSEEKSQYNNINNQNNVNGGFQKKQQTKRINSVWDTSTTLGRIKYLSFMAWLLASVVIMIVFWSIEKKSLAVAVFGQLLAVAGTITFIKMKKNSEYMVLVLVPIVGAVVCPVCLIMYFFDKTVTESYNIVFPIILSSAFVAICLLSFVYRPLETKKQKNCCTISVKAVLIDFMIAEECGTDGTRRTTHVPIYEYYYDGKSYRHKGGGYIKGLSLGDEVLGYVNPDDPTDFCLK